MSVITSTQNAYIKHLVKLRTKSSYRQAKQYLVLSGKSVLSELPENYPIKTILLLEGYQTELKLNCQEIITVSESVLKKASGLEHPEPILAEVPMPQNKQPSTIQRLLVCESVSDPGNMGTLIRTALAFNWDAVYFLNNCVDPFNDKVLRASKGALFHLPYTQGSWKDFSSFVNKYELNTWLADLKGLNPNAVPLNVKLALLVCNESQGPSSEALEYCQAVSLPMPGKMESLNVAVAGGILMYTLSQKN